MRVEATVVGMRDGRAIVRPSPGQSCGSGCCACSSMASCAPEVAVATDRPVAAGTQVLVDMPSSGVTASALLIFVAPLLGLVGGVLLGDSAGSDSAGGLAVGLALFAVVLVIGVLVYRYVVQPRLPQPKIVAVLGEP
ncbi:SoxR reducing system RseC family protein [bacterium]|nr:SoxR reducing system RseC family protein [bacterium]